MLNDFTTRPELSGTFGAIASTHWLASAAGMAVLEKGGNAFDAAVAAGFVLQVVEPHQNGPGGEVPIILKAANRPDPIVICGQGVSPAAATRQRLVDLGLVMVPGTGMLPAVVPGAFGAWMLLLRDHGTLSPRDVMSYAIGYAENGFPLLPRAVATIYPARQRFTEDWPSSGAVWLPGGNVPRPGALFRLPALAATYKRILAEAEAAGGDRIVQIEAARRSFYEGFVAEAVDRFYRETELPDARGNRYPGLLRGEDLSRWTATSERTVSYAYGGCEVHTTGPWGQGPALLQQLALLEGFDLAAMDPEGPDFVHTLLESAKLALVDRDLFYGDPVADVPLGTLLSKDYSDARRRLISAEASHELRPGDLPMAAQRLATLVAQAGRDQPLPIDCGEPVYEELPPEPGDTCHLDVVDSRGNMVSATPSGGWLQGSPAVPGLGFCITTRGQMFWLDEGLPTTLRPGIRPRTTLSPVLVTRAGEPWLALGAPGGDQQCQWPLTALLRVLHHRMPPHVAIESPNFHSVHYPSSFYPRRLVLGRAIVEGRMPDATLRGLEARGHQVVRDLPWSLGRVCMVERREGLLRAAASPRQGQAYAICR
jgi:gamma-glutamyltranspeptidase/glutathione hydrolase